MDDYKVQNIEGARTERHRDAPIRQNTGCPVEAKPAEFKNAFASAHLSIPYVIASKDNAKIIRIFL